MKIIIIPMLTCLSFFISPLTHASLNLAVKIGHKVGNKMVEVNKVIASDYNKEIIINSDGLKNSIVLNLRKFSNVLVNGDKISPVQIDLKMVNEMQKTIGRPQTVTSFYNRTAKFAMQSTGVITDDADINISLNFNETN